MRIFTSLIVALLSAAVPGTAMADDAHASKSLSHDVVSVYKSVTLSKMARVAESPQTATQGSSFEVRQLTLEIADVDAPLAQYPVSYLIQGQTTIDGSCCFQTIPPGTQFEIYLPDETTHLETAALNPMFGDFDRIDCSSSTQPVVCTSPDDQEVFFPVSIGVIHHQPGDARVGVQVNAAPGDTIDGELLLEFESVVEEDSGETAVIDVLLLYSKSMPERFPGTRLDTEFDTWIAFSNRVLAESGVNILLRRVGIQKLDIDDDLNIFQARTEAAESDTYAALRESYGADLAVLYRPLSRPESCGVATLSLPGRYLASHSTSLAIVQDAIMNCADGASIFLHEIGHLLGLGHDIGVPRSATPRGYWEFARGHTKKIGADPQSGNEFLQGTIMAANSTNRKSNPNVICPQGFPCGVEFTHPEQADSALSLNALRHQAADAMPSLSPPDELDLGVFIRGLAINADQVRVQLNVQNYSSVESSGSPLLLAVPAGWTLNNDETLSLANCTQEGADIHCDLGAIPGYGLRQSELVLDTNGNFGSLITATLLVEDGFVTNNISRYDPRVMPRTEVALHEQSSGEGESSIWGTISFRSDAHVAMPMQVVQELVPGQELLFPPQFTAFTGFDFDRAMGVLETRDCMVSDNLIECEEIGVKPIYDPDYEIPAINTAGRLSFYLTGDSPSQAPRSAAPPTDLPDMLDRRTLDKRITGNYFDVGRSGEGCQLTREGDGETYILTCYMYESGEQVWLIGVGNLQGNRLWFEEMTITSGADYGSAFDADDVARENWGSMELVFRDCNNAILTWSSILPNFEDFSVDLTKIIEADCMQEVPDSGIADFSGNYFDSDRSGEGFQIALEANRETYIATYYTYLNGKQVWLIGTGQLIGNEISFDDLVITEGAGFGSDFQAEDVVRIPWGTLTMRFTDCNNAVVEVEPELAGFEPQTLTVSRIVPAVCD